MRLPRRVEAVVFDMDGVIFDTEVMMRDAVITVSRTLGREIPNSLVLSMVGLPNADCDDLLHGHFGGTIDTRGFWVEADREFDRLTAGELLLKPGFMELLDFLETNRIPKAIATSSERALVERHLKSHDLCGRFEAIVAHGDYPRSKPNPDPYLMAASRLGFHPPNCLAIEDSTNGIRSAVAAGMMTVMIPDLVEPTDDIRTICLGVVRDLHEIRLTLQQHHPDHLRL